MMLLFKDMCWINFIVSEVVASLFFACKFKYVTDEISKALDARDDIKNTRTARVIMFIVLMIVALLAVYIAISIPVSGACTVYNRMCCM